MITITINITISINILHTYIYIIYICNYVCMCCGLLWFFGEWPATRVPNMWAPCRTFGTPSEPCGQMICGWCFRWIGWIDGWDLIDSHYMRLIHTQPLYGFSSLVFWFSIYEICFFFLAFVFGVGKPKSCWVRITTLLLLVGFAVEPPLIWIVYCPACKRKVSKNKF